VRIIRRLLPLAFLGLMMAAPAFSQPLLVSAANNQVSMISGCATSTGFCFSPASISIQVGSTLTWSNTTTVTHTATADPPGTWDTGLVAPTQTTTPITFQVAGSFPYHCSIHPSMKGTVVVTGTSSQPAQYHALAPSRLMDTRTTGQPLQAGGSLNLTVTGGQVPGTATAVALNVTVTNTGGPGFLTVFPTGNPRPTASNLNWATGETRPNLVAVQIGVSGLVTFFASNRTDVVADLEGYFAPPSGTAGEYIAVAPARLLDTRPGRGPLTAGTTLDLMVTGKGAVPAAGVSAVVLNATVTNTSTAGYLTAYPTGTTRPTASNLNWVAGWTVPNRVIVPVGSGGQVTFFNFAGVTDLVVDMDGYFTDATGSGKRFNALSPTRIMDTRSSSQTLGPGGMLPVQVGGVGVSSGATAAILNVTATNTTTPGFLTVYPGGTLPVASDLNFTAGQTIPNLVVATLSSTGSVTIYNSSGSTDVVVDLVGWFG
jgi:plastocyanin